MTNFELGTRVPLIISAPWLTASKGQRSMALAEAVDLYPTLSELAMGAGQLPTGKAGEYLGGASLAPIFKDISVKVKNVSLSQFSRCECLFPPRLLFSLVWLLARLLQEAYFLQPLSYRDCYQISSSAEKETDRGCLPTLPHGMAGWDGWIQAGRTIPQAASRIPRIATATAATATKRRAWPAVTSARSRVAARVTSAT